MASTMRNRVLPTLAIVLGFWIIMAVVLLPAIVQATAYVHCNWLRCLNVLEQDRTGLLTGFPKSTEREKESGLSQVSILSKFGQLYTTPGVDIETFRKLYFMQLLGKKIHSCGSVNRTSNLPPFHKAACCRCINNVCIPCAQHVMYLSE